MYTSLMTLVLAVQASTQGADISWCKDYTHARMQCTAEKKPIAVILGTGEKGYNQLSPEGLSKEAAELLASKYVCVYVDTTSPKGKQIADTFQMPTGKGIVLSDRTGGYQNYWKEGTLSNQDLLARLAVYSSEEGSNRVTNYESVQPAPVAQPAYGGSYCPSCVRGR